MAEKKTITIKSKRKTDNGYEEVEKEYTPVDVRLDDFRGQEKYLEYAILDGIHEINEHYVIMHVSILDDKDRVVSRAHALEFFNSSFINKTSALENAATSALGRALRYAGVGSGPIASSDEVATAQKQQEEIEKQEQAEHQSKVDEAVSQAKGKAENKKASKTTVENKELEQVGEQSGSSDNANSQPRAKMTSYYLALVNELGLKFSDIMKRVLELKKAIKDGNAPNGITEVDITFTDFKQYYNNVSLPVGRYIFESILTEKGLVEKYTKTPIEVLLADKK